jgi:hypothetical protein
VTSSYRIQQVEEILVAPFSHSPSIDSWGLIRVRVPAVERPGSKLLVARENAIMPNSTERLEIFELTATVNFQIETNQFQLHQRYEFSHTEFERCCLR